MNLLESMLRRFGDDGLRATISVGARRYRCSAHRVPARGGERICWRLEAVDPGEDEPGRTLTFGFAREAREALEAMLHAAEEHARADDRPGPARRARTFRPSPQD